MQNQITFDQYKAFLEEWPFIAASFGKQPEDVPTDQEFNEWLKLVQHIETLPE